ncbi:MAG: hypothetical protein IJQ80_06495 [Clostridia bacterium]|nr:hypothetical protein [Clostridia bacterium]
MADITGLWGVAKTMWVIGDESDFYTRDEVKADLEGKVASGEMDESEIADLLGMFDAEYEFTPDGRIVCWMRIPEDVPEDELRAALDAGEILGLRDGLIALEEKAWEEHDGVLVYDTGEERELFGEEQSSFDELTLDDEGLLTFGSGMMKLKRI